MNDAAEAILARSDSPLALEAGSVRAVGPEDSRQLSRLVLDACSSEDGVMPGLGGKLLLPSDNENARSSRLVLSIAPFLQVRAYGLAAERCAVIMMRELAPPKSEEFAEHFRQMFVLTIGEARLAASLAAGKSLKEAAGDQGIQFSTARFYLENIFRKTATHRQSELMALFKTMQQLS
jgi:DNA-binding CsgD family transcriptional regulator